MSSGIFRNSMAVFAQHERHVHQAPCRIKVRRQGGGKRSLIELTCRKEHHVPCGGIEGFDCPKVGLVTWPRHPLREVEIADNRIFHAMNVEVVVADVAPIQTAARQRCGSFRQATEAFLIDLSGCLADIDI